MGFLSSVLAHGAMCIYFISSLDAGRQHEAAKVIDSVKSMRFKDAKN